MGQSPVNMQPDEPKRACWDPAGFGLKPPHFASVVAGFESAIKQTKTDQKKKKNNNTPDTQQMSIDWRWAELTSRLASKRHVSSEVRPEDQLQFRHFKHFPKGILLPVGAS